MDSRVAAIEEEAVGFYTLLAGTLAGQALASYPLSTIGEAAAVTIVSAEGGDWKIDCTTRNEKYDLCTITMPWYVPGSSGSERVGKDGPARFTSYGALLREVGFKFEMWLHVIYMQRMV